MSSYIPSYEAGSHKAICDICGELHKSTKMKKQWDGLYACKECWTPRQDQDFVRGRADDSSVPWTRTPGVAIEGQICPTRSAVVGIATVGCALVGTNTKNTVIPTGTFSQAI